MFHRISSDESMSSEGLYEAKEEQRLNKELYDELIDKNQRSKNSAEERSCVLDENNKRR